MAQINLEAPKTVTIKNDGTEVAAFRYFRVNFVESLQPFVDNN